MTDGQVNADHDALAATVAELRRAVATPSGVGHLSRSKMDEPLVMVPCSTLAALLDAYERDMAVSKPYQEWVTAALEAMAQHRWSRAEECLTRALALAVEEAVEKARHAG